jgi:hypothetical protein
VYRRASGHRAALKGSGENIRMYILQIMTQVYQKVFRDTIFESKVGRVLTCFLWLRVASEELGLVPRRIKTFKAITPKSENLRRPAAASYIKFSFFLMSV